MFILPKDLKDLINMYPQELGNVNLFRGKVGQDIKGCRIKAI